MNQSIARVSVGLYLVILAELVASCATSRIPDGPTVEAVVRGTPSDLATFDQKLRRQLGDEPLSCYVEQKEAPNERRECKDLEKNSASAVVYGFIGEHREVYEKFGAAFNSVERKGRPPQAKAPFFEKADQGLELTMDFKAATSVPANCAGYNDSNCKAAAWCTQFNPACSLKVKPNCVQCVVKPRAMSAPMPSQEK
jgi:hypothetical protein